MKRTLHTTLITTILLSLLFVSCNADASAGLFRQLADAKAPVGITYKQIIGKDATHLYFLTDDGIYKKKDGTSSELVLRSTTPILTASLSGPTITYTTNKEPKAKGGIDIWQVGTDGAGNTQKADPALFDGFTKIETYRQLSNGYFVVQGVKAGSPRSFSVATYDGTAFSRVVTIDNLDGYELQGTLLLSGHGSAAIAASTPMILSLVNGSSYTHYYVSRATAHTLNLDKRLSGFAINDANLYIITEDGYLYGSIIPAGVTTPNEMVKLSRQYSPNSFVYEKSTATTTYLITKSKADNEALYLINFPKTLVDNSDVVSEKTISDGYAKHMNNVTIVDSFVKLSDDLLIATLRNGMFDISIPTPPTSGGTSVGPENYSL
jgi:hypothetical protein